MTTKPTPETDKQIIPATDEEAGKEMQVVTAEFARSLERSRDKWMAKLDAVAALLPTGDAEQPFDPVEPACEMCGDMMYLADGCEWSETPGDNICNSCAQELVGKIRQAIAVAQIKE
jgi:hypothetical protein